MNYLIKKQNTLSSINGYLFLFGIILFAFDFIIIKISENYSYELKGYELIFGIIKSNPLSTQTFPTEFWAVFTIILLLVGLFLCLLNNRKVNAYLFLLCLAGIVGLLILQIKFYFDYIPKNLNWSSISFEYSYWIIILDYAVIGCISFIENSKSNNGSDNSPEKNQTININIITQEKEKNN